MRHAFATYFRQRNFNTTFFAGDAAVFHTLVFTAQAFVIFYRAENSGTEKAIFFRLECPVIDGFRFFYLTERLYLAAWEFEYAIKLMPDRVEPINNLGMVYEEVGKLEKAIEMYSMAYTIDPQNPEVIGNLTRCSLRRGDSVEQVRPLLEDLVFLDSRPEWVDWAKEQLVFSQVKTSQNVNAPTPEPSSSVPSELPSENSPELLPEAAPVVTPAQVDVQQFQQFMRFDNDLGASSGR